MPSKSEIERSLDILKNQIAALGDEIDEELNFEAEDKIVRGLTCKRGDQIYQILTIEDPDIEYFQVRYIFDAQQIVAQEMKRRSEGEESPLDTEEDEDYMNEAKKKLIRLSKSEFKKVRKGLVERLVSTDTQYEIETIDSYGIRQFYVEKKIFPLKEFHNIKKLDDAVVAVCNKGILGGVFLGHSYELEDFFDDKLEPETDENESDLGYIG